MAVRSDAFPDELVRPQVTNIRAQGDSATRTYRVEAALPPGSRLMIGMTVDVNIEIGRRDDALLVPESAIRHNPSQGGQPGSAFVFQVHDGRVHRVPVVLGAAGPEVVEIRDGLPAEAQVVVNPPDRLRDGGRVQPMNRASNP